MENILEIEDPEIQLAKNKEFLKRLNKTSLGEDLKKEEIDRINSIGYILVGKVMIHKNLFNFLRFFNLIDIA